MGQSATEVAREYLYHSRYNSLLRYIVRRLLPRRVRLNMLGRQAVRDAMVRYKAKPDVESGTGGGGEGTVSRDDDGTSPLSPTPGGGEGTSKPEPSSIETLHLSWHSS